MQTSMSSPRKYSSPYLSSLPGLVSTSAAKVKKRSKSSLPGKGVPTPNATLGETQYDKNSLLVKSNNEQVSYDPSSGDVDQTSLDNMKNAAAAKPIDILLDDDEIAIQDEVTADSIPTKESTVKIDPTNVDSDNQTKLPLQSQPDMKNDCAAAGKEEQAIASVSLSPSLKSILKAPCVCQPKSKVKDGNNKTATKSSKTKSGKVIHKEAQERDTSSSRLTIKSNVGLFGSGATSTSNSKLEIFQQKYSRPRSPRRKSKHVGPGAKVNEKGQIPLIPKKSVRFATRIDIYHVPYESRAGSRACDWQRNMMEQRLQNFRQLMKEVGSEDMDIYTGGGAGASMLFPGYPYHLPNPNFSLRGRVRNFKF